MSACVLRVQILPAASRWSGSDLWGRSLAGLWGSAPPRTRSPTLRLQRRWRAAAMRTGAPRWAAWSSAWSQCTAACRPFCRSQIVAPPLQTPFYLTSCICSLHLILWFFFLFVMRNSCLGWVMPQKLLGKICLQKSTTTAACVGSLLRAQRITPYSIEEWKTNWSFLRSSRSSSSGIRSITWLNFSHENITAVGKHCWIYSLRMFNFTEEQKMCLSHPAVREQGCI